MYIQRRLSDIQDAYRDRDEKRPFILGKLPTDERSDRCERAFQRLLELRQARVHDTQSVLTTKSSLRSDREPQVSLLLEDTVCLWNYNSLQTQPFVSSANCIPAH